MQCFLCCAKPFNFSHVYSMLLFPELLQSFTKCSSHTSVFKCFPWQFWSSGSFIIILLKVDILHKMYYDHDFLSFISSQILPAFLSIQLFRKQYVNRLMNKQTNQNTRKQTKSKARKRRRPGRLQQAFFSTFCFPSPNPSGSSLTLQQSTSCSLPLPCSGLLWILQTIPS